MIGDLSILDLFRSSPTMVVLLGCSIVTVGFAVERWLYFLRHSMGSKGLMKSVAPKIRNGNLRGALEIVRNKRGAASRILEQGLSHAHMAHEQLVQRINTAIEVEQVEMERNINVLGTMSNIAPLLGLFGTVVGIIRAFADIARTGSGGSAVVAMGVAEALLTTAAGIIVAVIATVCFNIFVRMIRARTVMLEDVREEFFALMSEQDAAAAAPAQRRRQAALPSHAQEPAAADLLT